MKKIVKLLLVAVVAVGLNASLASAAASCAISGTGPNSNNICTIDNQTQITFRCENGVLINTSTDQQVTTGDAQVIDNNSAGGATSGNASNQSKTLVEVVAECAAQAQSKPKPRQPEQPKPQQPEQNGGGVVSGDQVEKLPVTGTQLPSGLLAAAGLFATAALATRLSLSAIRRNS